MGALSSFSLIYITYMLAEKLLVVVTTRFFLLSDLVTNATTGSLTPLSRKALLKAFRKAKGEKVGLFPVGDLMRISLFEARGLVGLLVLVDLALPTRVHSWGVAEGGVAEGRIAFEAVAA